MGKNLPFVDLGQGVTATRVSAGQYHNCAVLTDATVKCWGLNHNGQLGLGDTTSRGTHPCHMGERLPRLDLDSVLEDLGNSSTNTALMRSRTTSSDTSAVGTATLRENIDSLVFDCARKWEEHCNDLPHASTESPEMQE
eukprot:3775856-Amphidinium_carterae.1